MTLLTDAKKNLSNLIHTIGTENIPKSFTEHTENEVVQTVECTNIFQ